MKPHYYLKAIAPERWMICSFEDNQPLYDDEPRGNDRPVIFHDEDTAYEALMRLNGDQD